MPKSVQTERVYNPEESEGSDIKKEKKSVSSVTIYFTIHCDEINSLSKASC